MFFGLVSSGSFRSMAGRSPLARPAELWLSSLDAFIVSSYAAPSVSSVLRVGLRGPLGEAGLLGTSCFSLFSSSGVVIPLPRLTTFRYGVSSSGVVTRANLLVRRTCQCSRSMGLVFSLFSSWVRPCVPPDGEGWVSSSSVRLLVTPVAIPTPPGVSVPTKVYPTSEVTSAVF